METNLSHKKKKERKTYAKQVYDSQSFIMILGTKDDEWNHVNVSAVGDGSLVNAGFKILQTLACSPVNEATTLLKLWQQSYGYFPLLSKISNAVKRLLHLSKYQWHSKWWKTPLHWELKVLWLKTGCLKRIRFFIVPFNSSFKSGLFCWWRQDVHCYNLNFSMAQDLSLELHIKIVRQDDVLLWSASFKEQIMTY